MRRYVIIEFYEFVCYTGVGRSAPELNYLAVLVHSSKVVQPGYDIAGGQNLEVLPKGGKPYLRETRGGGGRNLWANDARVNVNRRSNRRFLVTWQREGLSRCPDSLRAAVPLSHLAGYKSQGRGVPADDHRLPGDPKGDLDADQHVKMVDTCFKR